MKCQCWKIVAEWDPSGPPLVTPLWNGLNDFLVTWVEARGFLIGGNWCSFLIEKETGEPFTREIPDQLVQAMAEDAVARGGRMIPIYCGPPDDDDDLHFESLRE